MAKLEVSDFGRDLLMELAISKGINYDRQTVKRGSPSKAQVLQALRSIRIDKPNEVLSDIQEMKRRIKLWVLLKKAKELGIPTDAIRDNRFKLAIHIYAKDRDSLNELSLYQKSEPKKSTMAFESIRDLTLDDWINKEKRIKQIVESKLTDRDADSIVTLDHITPLGNTVRCEIGFDYRKRIVERKRSPLYPNRDGSYDAYPLKRIVVTYSTTTKTAQISAPIHRVTAVAQAFSEALTGSTNNFQIKTPSADEAIKSLVNEEAQENLKKSSLRVVELELLNVPWEGNVSFLHLKGENLLETLMQLHKSDIPTVGKNLAKLSRMTFEASNKGSISIDYQNGRTTKTGDFSDEDEMAIFQILSSWGVQN